MAPPRRCSTITSCARSTSRSDPVVGVPGLLTVFFQAVPKGFLSQAASCGTAPANRMPASLAAVAAACVSPDQREEIRTMDRLTFKQKLVGIVLALVVVAGVTVSTLLVQEQRVIRSLGDLVDHDVALMDRAHQLNLAVVQVQQWLSDISATRGLDGLNDGFDEAAGQAKRFHELLSELRQLDAAHQATYDKMSAAFERYYEVGQEMAKAYISGGPAAGNVLMPKFDKAAEALSEQIVPFVERARAGVAEQAQQDKTLSGQLLFYTVIGSLAFLAVVGLMAWLFHGIFRTIGHDPVVLSRIAEAIAAGELDTEYEGQSKATGLYQALLRMRDQLREQMQHLREQLSEVGRMRSALENADAAITVSDENNTLIFMNEAARRLFTELAPAIARNHPGFSVDKLIGGRLRDYFDDEAGRAAFSRPLDSTITVDSVMGDRQVRFVASPVYDEEKTYLGRVTQWVDRTEEIAAAEEEARRLEDERRLAAENARIRAALDNVGSSVMVADQDYNIIYLNKSVERMFREAAPQLREALPGFDPEDLRGKNMDLFHRDPRHQRAMLDGIREAVENEVEVNGLTLRIVANPVFDQEGNRIGTAVEWTNRTAEVKVEREIEDIVAAAKNGELSRRIALDGKRGFFRQLGVGMNQLLDVVENGFSDIAATMKRMAEGDLTKPITREYAGVFERVKQDVNTTIENIQRVVQQLHAASESIASASGEISSGNTNLSNRTEQQAAALQETAASMEELTSTVRNNAENARVADQVATSASQLANQGGEVVGRTVTAMKEINDASERIAEIIGVIDEIAFQTNLLALNASVEAARAGEQGRGFAVVATEVRNLASRSAEAAKEIKELIQDSVTKVQAGSALVDESGSTLEEIVVSVKKVGDIIAEIAAASSEQLAGIEQVNQAVTSMDEVTQQNAALAEQTSAASASLSEKAVEMRRLVSFFKTAEGTGAERVAPAGASAAASVEHRPAATAVAPTRPAEKATPTSGVRPVPEPRPKAEPVESGDDEWEEF
ncbi:MAG: methyl-accepting chemotaxis protein [Gammaproteobacteria bacterium]|nr:MAG: methyl-accepting chemotaxis protein [Gammaproteobacteria bacterium]